MRQASDVIGNGVRQVKKHPFVVQGKVTFALDVVMVDHREALDYVQTIIDGLQKELAGYYSVHHVREWEVGAENVRRVSDG